jgi:hypothetical protein
VLNLSLGVSPSVADPGETVTISVLVSGGAGAVTAVLTVDGAPVPLSGGSASIVAPASGVHRIVATAADTQGSLTREAVYSVRDPADTSSPLAEITSPAIDSEVTAPVEVIGTAAAPQLTYWQLLLRPAGEGAWREVRRGFGAVTNGVLGRLDPTRLPNDIHELSLRVLDVNGREAASTVTVEVTRELKVGQFTLSFEDLNIEASGIPILITRTYDTQRAPERLDFGYGWSVDYQNVVLRKNTTLGLQWDVIKQTGQFDLCLRPRGKRKLNIRLPGGETARFEAVNQTECAFAQVPPVDIIFNPLPGTTVKLEAINHGPIIAQGGQLYDVDHFAPFDPQEFKLTTEDNFVFYLKQGVGIQRVADPYGNTLDYTANGLIHSSGQSIAFERDSQKRITRISDPEGKSLTYGMHGVRSCLSPKPAIQCRHGPPPVNP